MYSSLEARLCPSALNRRPVESVFDGKDVLCGYLPDPESLSCLPYMIDKKLGRDNSLVVVVHRYLQQLSPTSAAHVCTSDKRVETDRRLTALER